MVILITGGTGLIGTKLIALLNSAGHEVRNLSTQKKENNLSYYWNPLKNEIDSKAVIGVDAIIHLAGASIISHKWTEARKKVIVDSRVKGALLLAQACKQENQKIQHYITASGIGYYGNGEDKLLTELDDAGKSFAAQVCQKWETSALAFNTIANQTSIIRIGIVLSSEGGFWAEMKKLAKFKILSPLGSGRQYISWIHITDLCKIFKAIIENKIPSGTYNAVSSEPLSNKVLTKAIIKAYRSPSWLPNVPSFLLKIVLGERADELLNGQNASNAKLLKNGFKFEYEHLHKAIENIK